MACGSCHRSSSSEPALVSALSELGGRHETSQTFFYLLLPRRREALDEIVDEHGSKNRRTKEEGRKGIK